MSKKKIFIIFVLQIYKSYSAIKLDTYLKTTIFISSPSIKTQKYKRIHKKYKNKSKRIQKLLWQS